MFETLVNLINIVTALFLGDTDQAMGLAIMLALLFCLFAVFAIAGAGVWLGTKLGLISDSDW